MKQYFLHILRDCIKQHIAREAILSMLAVNQVVIPVRIENITAVHAMSAWVLKHTEELF